MTSDNILKGALTKKENLCASFSKSEKIGKLFPHPFQRSTGESIEVPMPICLEPSVKNVRVPKPELANRLQEEDSAFSVFLNQDHPRVRTRQR